jgi:bacterial/archaeal transporter family-2 protein
VPQPVPFWPIAGLMFLAGIGIPILATFNAQLGQQLASPVAAVFVVFVVGVIAATLLMLAVGVPSRPSFTFDRPYIYTAGLFMLFYILSITWAAPRIGLGNAIFFVLFGQLVAAAVIDHFGLWGAIKSAATPRRLAGIFVMAVGVYLARKPV